MLVIHKALASGALLAALALAGCGRAGAQRPEAGGGEAVATVARGRLTRLLRVGGTTAAVHAFTLRIPQIPGQSSQFVLVSIVANGVEVKQGEVLAQFDATAEIQNALDAKAKYDDLRHQVQDTRAQNQANAEQRASDLQQAEADLGKAQLELKKAPILSAIDAQTDRLNLEDAAAHIASLKKENALKAEADGAGLRGLELKRDQQQVEWERAQSTVAKLTLRAPLAGMVGLVPVYRANSEGPAQPGDQLYSGSPLLRIFDPSDMEVDGQINEADSATLTPGLKGVLHLDAYPRLRLAVHFLAASPVAVAGGFGVPIRTFAATFQVDQRDARLLPDLSAAVDLEITSPQPQLLVPRAAVHFVASQPYVSVRGANGQWREQAVELGNFDDQQVAIVGGLRAGERVRWRRAGGGA
ncbi:MAG TPA: HlyD family efflux transporter periplasmic adaptor subunit [Terriglobales bacterium]|nr:HlyD family efflux transporter periplasmic adaptor subunit [Terriglobales bacterium]